MLTAAGQVPVLWILPTRGRRVQAARCVEAFSATREADSRLIVAIDDDDTATYDGLTLPGWAAFGVGPHRNLRDALNYWAMPQLGQFPAIGWVADDALPVTPGWDRLLLAALSTPGAATPYNGCRPLADGGEHWLMSTAISQALGWYHPPYVAHYWGDQIIRDIGEAAGFWRFVPAARVDHIHYQHSADATRDETYQRAEVNTAREHGAYERWRAERMAGDIAAVAAFRPVTAG